MPNKKEAINGLNLKDKIYWHAEILLCVRYDYV